MNYLHCSANVAFPDHRAKVMSDVFLSLIKEILITSPVAVHLHLMSLVPVAVALPEAPPTGEETNRTLKFPLPLTSHNPAVTVQRKPH